MKKTPHLHKLCQTREDYRNAWDKRASQQKSPDKTSGPGTELMKLLHMVGLSDVPGCKCKLHATEMDRRGPRWCRDNIGTILGWLREEAERRKLPFIEIGARAAVLLAIRNAEQATPDTQSIVGPS